MYPNTLSSPKIQKHQSSPNMSLHKGKRKITKKFEHPDKNIDIDAAVVFSSMGKISPNITKVTGPNPIPYPIIKITIVNIGTQEALVM